MSRSAPNPSLFSGYDLAKADTSLPREPSPPLSAEVLARRAAEDAECAKATAAGKARLPFQSFVFYQAGKGLRSTVVAKTEADALTTLTSPENPAKAWKRIYNPAA